ncbi:outer membrane beta-barrel protein [Dyadobacter jiangsuensis]|uniref:Outer membrane protein with beta-barrel domain n=1 Tax=Dyadobacter jiangsuensis TaxID=1591085 RepID=A0A2P8G3X2_9BACT|nr:hypothetical protein [Dyadobacter jiangsuensis]PSL28680.1 hypothetical protein CLV60_106283 [Dyadobacter jiangsuensis]
MKIIYYTFLLIFCSATIAFAQLEGKRFISGAVSTNFDTYKPETGKSTNGYAYGVSIGLGKFKTATRAGEWSIFSNMNGSKKNFNLGTDTTTLKGIDGFGIGTGYRWSFYKHFSDKFGVFGGPGISVRYNYIKQFQSDGQELFEQKSNEISASLDLSAGAYYALNDRWWLTASLAFSNPVYATYSFGKSKGRTTATSYDNSGLRYQLSPSFNFPSVGIGLRYFFKD